MNFRRFSTSALVHELGYEMMQFEREVEMPVMYKDLRIGTRRADFLVDDKIYVELKAVVELENVHLAQAINYLKGYNVEIGLLINFGNTRLQFHRLENKKFEPY